MTLTLFLRLGWLNHAEGGQRVGCVDLLVVGHLILIIAQTDLRFDTWKSQFKQIAVPTNPTNNPKATAVVIPAKESFYSNGLGTARP